MIFFPQLSPIPACNRPTTWSLLPFCLVSPKHRQLPLVWAGVGDSARTEHAPLIPQPSLKHPIPAKTPFRQPHARHVAPQPGSHYAPPAPARRLPPFWALPQRPAQGLSLGRGGPRGRPAAPGRSSGSSSRLPAVGLRGCWAARPAPLRLVAAGGASRSRSPAAGLQAPVPGGEFIWRCARQWCPSGVCRVTRRFSVCQCWCLHVNPTPQPK